MSISIIVNGAAGRMGSTIAGLVKADPELVLAGAIERPGNVDALASLGCATGDSLDAVLPVDGPVAAIDFTSPESTVSMARAAARKNIPVVIGTTGLTPDQQKELEAAAEKTQLFWAPNMSVGVNVLLQVLPELVKKLGGAYDMEITEIHHNKKKDAPSGTAVKLAQCLAEARDWDLEEKKRYCREGMVGERPKDEIGVMTVRGGDVVGVHTVYFLGPGERIEVNHQAHSRETFAQGAIRAAKWLTGQKPGRLYTMSDML